MREPMPHGRGGHLRPAAQPRPPTPDDVRQTPGADRPGLWTRTEHDHGAGVVIVDVAGDLDTETCPVLADELASAADASIGLLVIVDLTGLRTLADCGAAVLRDTRADIERRRGCLQVVIGPTNPAASSFARRIDRHAGLRAHATVADARNGPRRRPAPGTAAGRVRNLAERRSRRRRSSRRR